jgi:hypothetical protein
LRFILEKVANPQKILNTTTLKYFFVIMPFHIKKVKIKQTISRRSHEDFIV